jgi:hypothetical protein
MIAGVLVLASVGDWLGLMDVIVDAGWLTRDATACQRTAQPIKRSRRDLMDLDDFLIDRTTALMDRNGGGGLRRWTLDEGWRGKKRFEGLGVPFTALLYFEHSLS